MDSSGADISDIPVSSVWVIMPRLHLLRRQPQATVGATRTLFHPMGTCPWDRATGEYALLECLQPKRRSPKCLARGARVRSHGPNSLSDIDTEDDHSPTTIWARS